MVFNIDSIDSKCVCVGIQQQGGDLEKDSFDFRYGFQLNCVNGDICRLGQTKDYVSIYKTPISNGTRIGVLLDMWNGSLSFTIDGVNCGVASKDKRLKQGKYFPAILLMNSDDKITFVNPRLLSKASLGYQTMFSKLNVEAEQNERFYKMVEEVHDYFTDMTQEKELHKMMLGAYLNNMGAFEGLCQKVREDDEAEKAQTQKGSLSNCYILKRLIYSFMNPVLIPYKDFHEEYRLSAFDSFIHQTISEVMNIHFMLVDVQNQTAK